MNLKSRKIISMALVFFMMLTILPMAPVTAHAAGTSGGGITLSGDTADWNVQISDAGVLSWTAQDGATTYNLEFYRSAADAYPRLSINGVTSNSCDLKAELENRGEDNFDYYLKIVAPGAGSTGVTPDMRIGYVSSLPKLSEPQTLTWDGYTAKWSIVPNAAGYKVTLYSNNGFSQLKRENVTSTEFNYEGSGVLPKDGWWFTVEATRDRYRNSNAAESPKYGEVVTPPATTYTITATAGEGGTVTQTGSGTYSKNDPVTVAAIPNTGYEFVEWQENGAQVSTDAAYTFIVEGNRNLVAVFKAKEVTPPATKYAINVVNGSTADMQYEYAEGAAVTIEAGSAPEGQQFKEWTGADDLTFIDGTSKTSATAKFTMPAKEVTVTATYEPIPAPVTKYAITVNGGSTADMQYEYAEGAAVTIEAGSAPEGQQFKEWTGTDDLNFIDGTSKTSATAKFTMPAKAVTVTATYEPIPAPATKYAINVVNGSTADMQYEYAEGAAVTIEAGSAPEGQQFKEWTGTDDLNFIDGTSKTSAIAKFTMPAKAVTVTATYEPIPAPVTKYAITVNGGSTADMQYEYAEGAAVTIEAGSAPEGQQFKEWTGTDDLNFIDGTSKTSAIAKFTMPAKAVTVTATYEPIPAPVTKYIVTVTNGTGSGDYAEGASVTITANAAPAGKVFDKWVIDGITVEDPTATTITFTMPANDIAAEATYKSKPSSSSGGGFSGVYNYPVIVGDTDGADVAVSDDYAVKGEKITITVKPDAGEQVDEVIVTDKDGKVIPVTKTGDNEYTFTMPASKVTVDVATEAADYGLRIVMQINNKNILVNGKTMVNDVAPVIVGDRTLVPIRVVTELLGGSADWDNATRTVTLKIDGKTMNMTIGKEIPGFGTSAVIMNDRTYVPVRYVMEKLGAEVEWIGATRQIIIEK